MKPCILDASALLSLLFDAPGAAEVKAVFAAAEKEGGRLAISTVQLGEVFHVIKNRPNHQGVLKSVRRLETSVEFVPLSVDLAEKAADIRRETGLYFADSVAAALADDLDGVLVTADTDFKRAVKRIPIRWVGKE